MTKALCSFPEKERFAIAKRRDASKSGGLGYLAAKDAMEHFGRPKIKATKTSEEVSESNED